MPRVTFKLIEDYLKSCHKGGEITSLIVSLCTDDRKIAKKALQRVYMMLKYYVNRSDEEYTFIVGLSNRDGQNLEKIIPYHLHVIVKGKNSLKLSQDVARRINRKAKLANIKNGVETRAIPAKTMQIKGLEGFDDCGVSFIPYALKQCSRLQQYSNATDENKFDIRNFRQWVTG
ncbi:MAG: hypothetical protein FWE04_00545 [Oscillospiraceae bacterium]|nr:hypothetical protein [Oscillospiraceae bacterium]